MVSWKYWSDEKSAYSHMIKINILKTLMFNYKLVHENWSILKL